MPGMRVRGQVAFGVERHAREGEELVGHEWLACVSPTAPRALTRRQRRDVRLRLSPAANCGSRCLRSPAYAGHPVDDVTPIVRQDRVEPRVDQGEHVFRFWLNAGPAAARLDAIDREATVAARGADGAGARSRRASGRAGRSPAAGVLSDEVVQMPAMKLAEDGRPRDRAPVRADGRRRGRRRCAFPRWVSAADARRSARSS